MLMKSKEVLYRNLDRTGETAEISNFGFLINMV